MRKLLCFLLICNLASAVLAQSGSVATAQDLANRLSASQELPRNVQLRFQVLSYESKLFSEKGDVSDLLNFFSDTRVMVWNRQVSPNVSQNMRELEQQFVALAKDKGYNLDLPPVGYAPQAAGTLRILSSERPTRDGMSNLILQTEQLATEQLQGHSSRRLLVLRDNLTRFREDVSDGSVSSDLVRALMGSRVRFLAGKDVQRLTDPRLLDKLDTLAEVLYGSFPPQRMRSSKGQQLSF